CSARPRPPSRTWPRAGWASCSACPPVVSPGLFPGGRGATATARPAAPPHAVLAEAGWAVERDGWIGAPPVEVVVGAERHVTVDVALRYLGLGSGRLRVVPADDQGRMDAAALGEVLADVE